MPTVARYTRQVDPAALPGARKTAAETELSTGAGLEQARAQKWGAVANLGGAIAQAGFQGQAQHDAVAKQQRDQADDLVALDAANQLATWEIDHHNEILSTKGQAALGLRDSVTKGFNTVADTLEQGLTSDRQRQAFARTRVQRGLSLHETVENHVTQQMAAFEASTVKATVESAAQLAIANALNPRRVGEELARAEAAQTAYAKRQGQPPEAVGRANAELRTSVHTGVIGRLLDEQQTGLAKAYYEETQAQIDGDKRGPIEKALSAGTQRAAAQKAADEILAAGGTLTEQREKARAIADPEVRDDVQQRLEHEASVRAVAQRDTDEAQLTSAYNILDQGRGVDAIPTSVWATLPGNARASLRAYAEQQAKGTPVETDLPTYYAFMQQAAEDPATFVSQNLLNYRHKLDEVEFKQLTNLQLSMRTKKPDAEKVLDDFRTEREVINNALTLAGIDPTPAASDKDTPKRVARFHGLVADEVRRVQDITKKKATNDEVAAIATRILSHEIIDKGWFWDAKRSLATATVDDVPAADRTQIIDALRRHGEPVTDDTVLDVWLKSQVRK